MIRSVKWSSVISWAFVGGENSLFLCANADSLLTTIVPDPAKIIQPPMNADKASASQA